MQSAAQLRKQKQDTVLQLIFNDNFPKPVLSYMEIMTNYFCISLRTLVVSLAKCEGSNTICTEIWFSAIIFFRR